MTSILSAKKSSWVTREDDRLESLYLRQKFQHRIRPYAYCAGESGGLCGSGGNRLVLVSEEEISSVLYENIIGNGCNGAGPCPMYMADSG